MGSIFDLHSQKALAMVMLPEGEESGYKVIGFK
jgi:hypothetical protein